MNMRERSPRFEARKRLASEATTNIAPISVVAPAPSSP
jgi:hypothetical protein